VVGEAAAGAAPSPLAARAAQRIFTGAALPEGADAVVMQEHVTREGDAILLSAVPPRHDHVRRRGEDLAAGTVALPVGTALGPGQVALAAACDRATLLVARRPVVALLASGDELRSPGDPARTASIPESNGYFVAAAARRAGAEARMLPFVRDDLDAAAEAVRAALVGADLVCSIGGVSVGDRDVMRPAMERCGVRLDFFRVAIKPGKPLVLGVGPGGQVVLGLPGNPASASLTFLLFGLPLLRAMQRHPSPTPNRVRMPLAGAVTRRAGRTEFARARIERGPGAPDRARLLPNQASGAVTGFALADALVVFPAERERVEDGEEVEVIVLRDLGLG
jgi:molybdopterin molybdotransferase